MVCIIQVCSGEEKDLTQAFHERPLRSKVIHINIIPFHVLRLDYVLERKLLFVVVNCSGPQTSQVGTKWPSLSKRPVSRQNAQQVKRQSQQGSPGKLKSFSGNPEAKDKATSLSHVE